MRPRIEHGLPFVAATVEAGGRTVGLPRVLVDTGSAGTVLSIARLCEIGVGPSPDDVIYTIRGVGGTENVFMRRVARLALGDVEVADIEVEVGALDYGIPMDGIIGMDFLMAAGVILDLAGRTMDRSS